MAFVVTGLGGVTFGTDMDVDLYSQEELSHSSDVRLRGRFGASPLYAGLFPNAWTGVLVVTPGDTAPADREEWRDDVMAAINPHHTAPRTLTAEYRTLDLEAEAIVTLTRHPAGIPLRDDQDMMLLFSVIIPEIAWRDTAVNGPSASPITVGGNYPALARYIITPDAASVLVSRITLGDSLRNRGFANYPICIEGIDTTGIGATDPEHYIGFFKRNPVGIFIVNPNNAASKVWFWGALDPSETDAVLDLFFGSDINNTVLSNDQFERGGIDLANSTPDHIIWDDLRPSIHPDACLVWRPGTRGGPSSEILVDLTQQGATAVKGITFATATFSFSRGGGINALVCVLGAEAAAVDAITNFDAVLTASAVGAQALLDYRIADSSVWQNAETVTVAVATDSFAATQDVDGATELSAYVLPFADGAGTLIFDVATPWEIDLDPDTIPVVSVGAAVAAVYVAAASIEHDTSGDRIDLTDLYWREEDLILDCLSSTAETEGGEVPYTGTEGGGILHVNTDAFSGLWLALRAGASNAFTVTGPISVTVEHQSRILL